MSKTKTAVESAQQTPVVTPSATLSAIMQQRLPLASFAIGVDGESLVIVEVGITPLQRTKTSLNDFLAEVDTLSESHEVWLNLSSQDSPLRAYLIRALQTMENKKVKIVSHQPGDSRSRNVGIALKHAGATGFVPREGLIGRFGTPEQVRGSARRLREATSLANLASSEEDTIF